MRLFCLLFFQTFCKSDQADQRAVFYIGLGKFVLNRFSSHTRNALLNRYKSHGIMDLPRQKGETKHDSGKQH